MKTVVITNKAQLTRWQARRSAGEYRVYCDNSQFYEILTVQGIPFTALDEFLLQDRWSEINSWGCGTVNDWIALCKRESVFPQADLASVIRLYFSHFLIQAIKNKCYADLIVNGHTYEEAFVFESPIIASYPRIDGNSYLNFFLSGACKKNNVKITFAQAPGATVYAQHAHSWKEVAKLLAKRGVLASLKCSGITTDGHDAIFYGALRHLGNLITELRGREKSAGIYDFDFHKDLYGFAKSHQCSYLVPDMFITPGSRETGNEFREQMDTALTLAAKEKLFTFDGYDLSNFIQEKISPGFTDYFRKLKNEKRALTEMYARNPNAVFIVDEDFALKGAYFSAFLRSQGAKVFCVSHANFPVNYEVKKSSRIFAQSTTFVQSEFEKDMYSQRGWLPDALSATGLPRYDSLKDYSREKNHTSRIKILYAAAVPWLHSSDQLGYLGEHYFCYANVPLKAFTFIVEALQGLPIEMSIKPHSVDTTSLWQKTVRTSHDSGAISVLDASKDFLGLLHQSDALILSYASTAILEAAMCEVPVFLCMDRTYKGFPIQSYIDNNYCHFFTESKGLNQALNFLCEYGRAGYLQKYPYKQRERFLGRKDHGASKRIAEIIYGQ